MVRKNDVFRNQVKATVVPIPPLPPSNVCLVGETCRAPSRHRRGERIYSHTTTAMHDNEYASPPFFQAKRKNIFR